MQSLEQYPWLELIDKNLYSELKFHKDNSPVLITSLENLTHLIEFVKNHNDLRFKILADIIGIDHVMHPKYKKRFSLVYNLLSIKKNFRLFIEIFLDDDEEVQSSHQIFKSATWLQREVYDMYGVKFKNADDHRRILTDYGFTHFPLRKDFPLTGYEEVRYDLEKKDVVYSPVKLEQDFRNFDFESRWEGE
jgi:NADH-quinone oxidoreductase subunit C